MDKVLAIDGVEDLKGKTVFKGLFGDDLVIVPEENEKPTVPVATKLTATESAELDEWACKFGISKYKFIRDCIREKLENLKILSEG